MRRAGMCRTTMMRTMMAVLCVLLLAACGDDEPSIVAATCAGEVAVGISGPDEIAGEYCGIGSAITRWTLRADRSFTRIEYVPPCPEGALCVRAGGTYESEGSYREAGSVLYLNFYDDWVKWPKQLQTVQCDERQGLSLVADGSVFAPSSCP